MTEQHTHASTWKSKINALGPGIMMASAAVGGSHLIASTQAGALYGWQLALIIILTNLFKYPFFRFSAHYTLDTGKSLIEGYAEKSRVYLWVFLILCIASATINAGAVAIVTAAIVKMAIPSLTFDAGMVSVMIMVSCLLILASGRYKALDNVSKIIIVSLTIATVAAAAVAMSRGMQMKPDFIEPTPWTLAGLGFLIALMGWMPAPIEISAVNSMWVVAKRRLTKVSYEDGLFDFNVGYIGTAILAVVFLALGALVQYGSPETVEMVGGKYIAQLINMYASTIGEWSRLLIAVIAFMCMFGTTITVIDGYSRTNVESLRILFGKQESSVRILNIGMIFAALSGLAIIFYFNNAVGPMLKFAMIASFVSAPIFAWLNLSLTKHAKHSVKGGLLWLSLIGLFYLTAFAGLFIAQQAGWLN